MDTLRIRAYNVLFGDAILISVPDRDPEGNVETRHILIDVGNVLYKKRGGADTLFKKVLKDILEVLDGKPLDLYIMTHEHLDHVQGLLYAEKNCYPDDENDLRQRLQTRRAWLTGSAEEGYYEKHEDAKELNLQFRAVFNRIDRYLRARMASGQPVLGAIEALWVNNDTTKTKHCVEYLRNLAENTSYVHREFEVQGQNPFHEIKIEIWAPEENTADYYGRFQPAINALGVTEESKGGKGKPALVELIPPQGVDAGAFYNLVNSRKNIFDNLLAIDKASNNTSIVFCLEWRGYRLLFTGDAEERSWKTMDREKVLKPVHFLKVSHHGSCNGTPDPELLDKVLPPDSPDDKPRYALVSTWIEPYETVPDEETLDLIRDRCDKLYELHKENGEMRSPGEHIDIKFEAP
jgi:beta-lactamase superfamily II metal-dependent hydrolase